MRSEVAPKTTEQGLPEDVLLDSDSTAVTWVDQHVLVHDSGDALREFVKS